DDARFGELARSGDVARRQADEMRATAVSASADADKARASYAASLSQVSVIDRSRNQLLATLARARSALTLAKQNLEHTIVRAPVDGVNGDRQVQIGEYVQAGTQLLTLVPLNTLYVVANFKETQTARMLAGQKARVSVDALNGETLTGTID